MRIELDRHQFASYPPEARALTEANFALIQKLPLGFVPLLMREVIAYDWKFPAERREIDIQFSYLNSLSGSDLERSMAPFAGLRLSKALEQLDWVNTPAVFSEQLSAHLWATHQIDAFRSAAVDYVERVHAAYPLPLPSAARLAVILVGQGVQENSYPLFRKLRPQGVYFRNVDPANGHGAIAGAVAKRVQAFPGEFEHWYIDGGSGEMMKTAGLARVSYAALQPVRRRLLAHMTEAMQSGGGPEALRSSLAHMRPEDVGLGEKDGSPALNHFQVSLLTEGSGTQLFSTTFVQWGTREALRRAQPLTVVSRYAPRRRDNPMTEPFSPDAPDMATDARGALIDADMGAYYTWINQQRLPGAEKACLVVWFEGHNEALASGPSFAKGTESSERVTLEAILNRMG